MLVASGRYQEEFSVYIPSSVSRLGASALNVYTNFSRGLNSYTNGNS